jgi:antitoxin CptB
MMLDPTELSRLKWRSRRGLLENDLVLENFYRRHEADLTPERVRGLKVLLDLPDNDLWDLVAGRRELEAGAAPAAHEILRWMRNCEIGRQASQAEPDISHEHSHIAT